MTDPGVTDTVAYPDQNATTTWLPTTKPASSVSEEYDSTEVTQITDIPVFDTDLNCVRRYYNKSENYYIYKGYSGIPHTLTFALIVWLIIIVLFILIRRYTLGRHRATSTREETEGPPNTYRTCFAKYFGWIIFTIKLGDQQITGKCGPDAYLYLVFQRYLIVYMAVVCCVSICIVLPVNYHGNLITDAAAFGRTTIANVEGNSSLLWVHVVVALVYLVLALVFMKRLKKLHLAARTEAIKTKTLMLTNLPPGYNLDKALVEYFRESYQETFVEGFNQAYDVKIVSSVYAQRQRMHDLKDLTYDENSATGMRELMWRHSCGFCSACCSKCGCVQVDAAEFYAEEEKRLSILYHAVLNRTLSHPLDIAFVTFSTEAMAKRVWCVLSQPDKIKDRFIRYCTSCCSQKGGAADIRKCGVYYAPEPEDIYWENLSQSRVWWWIKAILLNIIFLVLLFIVTTPAVIMNLLNEWQSWEKLQKLHDNPGVTAIAPVLVLWIFSALLPAAVYLTEGLVGHWTRSKEQKIITTKTFIFLLMMVLILPSLGLTSAKAMLQWLMDRRAGAKVRWSCIFLPDNGAFFVNYVIAACFIGTAVRLLRVWDLICLGLRLLLSRSSAEMEMAWKKLTSDYFRYGVEYAWILVLFSIMVSYSVSVPLITPIGLLYLLLKHFVDRHNIYYAYKASKMSSEPHHKAINFVHTAVILLQCNVVAFIMLRSDGMPPPPAYFALIVLIGALVYLTSRSIMACARRAIRVLVNVQDMETGLTSSNQLVYLPDVVLWGSTTAENLRKSIAPRVTLNDL